MQCKQLKQIPSHRAIIELRESTKALESSLFLLRGIAAATQTESESMSKLAKEGRKDSTRLRTLTYIATIYLPPTLIAVSFVFKIPLRITKTNGPRLYLALI